MVIEKLTKYERETIAKLRSCDGGADARKAVSIIDGLTAKCDAQAAVIERVRALIADRKHPRFGPGHGGIYVLELEAALAADGVFEQGYAAGWQQGLRDAPTAQLERDLAAANARVAELERDKAALLESNKGLASMVDTANARADAAERKVLLLQADAPALVRRVQELEDGLRASNRDGCAEIAEHERTRGRADRAESEAAALRAAYTECVAHKNDAIDQACELHAEVERLRDEHDNLRAAHELQAEELGAERAAHAVAEVELQRIHKHLAAANALLREGASIATRYVPEWRERVCAHLSGQAPARSESALPTASDKFEEGYAAGWLQGQRDAPKAPTRRDHERAVLAAMRDAMIGQEVGGRYVFATKTGEHNVCKAELARREAVR